MKYLEARKQGGQEQKDSLIPAENKMQQGTRLDQRDPQSLISGVRNRSGKEETGTDATLVSLAAELGVDLSTVKGTGPKGRITEKDVRQAKQDAPDGEQK
jgi:pyruvate/2-oxoglutarate dehydrogenase complex dihydrolipoamide acyltransferase (E2) component